MDGEIRHLAGTPLSRTVKPFFPLYYTLIPQTFQNSLPEGKLDSSQARGVMSDPVVVHVKLGKILFLPWFPLISTEFHLLFHYMVMQCQLCRQLSFALPSVTWCHQPEMKLFWQVIRNVFFSPQNKIILSNKQSLFCEHTTPINGG